VQLQDILDDVAALSTKATTVLDDADKIIADNAPTIHSALTNVDQFSKALADNSAGVDAALKSVGELGKQIGPLAARLQTLSDDADRLVQSIDTDQVRAIVGNVQAMSAKGVSVIDRADKLLADNSDSIQSTLHNADVFSKALADNAPNVDTTLKNLAEISKTVQPVVAQIQSLSQDADRLIKAVEPDQIHALLNNAQTFSQALADSSDNVKALARDGAVLAGHLNDSANRLDTALIDADSLLKAVDSQKIAGIVDSANDVVQTVRQNRGNIDSTLKNFSSMSAKLNDSADKVDGVLTAAQNFLGAPGTKGAVDRISEAALSVKKLADDVDSRIKDIATGLSRFTNTGLREYEALAVEARRTVQDIDGVVRSLGRNPSQVLFGSRPALPEYHGGQ
jgi:phospholipid/cholesterol/gamma-HCH transport system substrate-binding protein